MKIETINQGIEFLFQLRRAGIKLDLIPLFEVLTLLGNPQNEFKVIHITGTNGKGSCGALTEFLLRYAGYKTGFFSSPHLNRFSERIRVNGQEIPDEEFLEHINKILECSIPLSFFEMATIIALLHFKKHNIDIAILEVGLGGRLDSTNVCNSDISIITSIAEDHSYSLGTNLSKIAWEKAGIIKSGKPLLIPKLAPGVKNIIKDVANSKGAKIFEELIDFQFRPLNNSIKYRFRNEKEIIINQILTGEKQSTTLALSLTAFRIITDNILNEDFINSTLAKLNWAGRFEQIENFILDGAHNAPAGKELANTIESAEFAPINIILGMMADKDIENFIKPLLKIAKKFFIVPTPSERSCDPGLLTETVRKMGGITEVANFSLKNLISNLQGKENVLITGSFYLVGEARSILLNEINDHLPLTDPSQ